MNVLSDQKKFTIVNLTDDILQNFAVNQEKRVDKVLKKRFECNGVTENTRKSIKPVGSIPGVLYSSCKVHKAGMEICSSFRPIWWL